MKWLVLTFNGTTINMSHISEIVKRHEPIGEWEFDIIMITGIVHPVSGHEVQKILEE